MEKCDACGSTPSLATPVTVMGGARALTLAAVAHADWLDSRYPLAALDSSTWIFLPKAADALSLSHMLV